jgi:hypothetical protein
MTDLLIRQMPPSTGLAAARAVGATKRYGSGDTAVTALDAVERAHGRVALAVDLDGAAHAGSGTGTGRIWSRESGAHVRDPTCARDDPSRTVRHLEGDASKIVSSK